MRKIYQTGDGMTMKERHQDNERVDAKLDYMTMLNIINTFEFALKCLKKELDRSIINDKEAKDETTISS